MMNETPDTYNIVRSIVADYAFRMQLTYVVVMLSPMILAWFSRRAASVREDWGCPVFWR